MSLLAYRSRATSSEGTFPSLFEPIHGSASDIAGEGVANPAGAIWAASLLLEQAGHENAGRRVLAALEEALVSGLRIPDLGGSS